MSDAAETEQEMGLVSRTSRSPPSRVSCPPPVMLQLLRVPQSSQIVPPAGDQVFKPNTQGDNARTFSIQPEQMWFEFCRFQMVWNPVLELFSLFETLHPQFVYVLTPAVASRWGCSVKCYDDMTSYAGTLSLFSAPSLHALCEASIFYLCGSGGMACIRH